MSDRGERTTPGAAEPASLESARLLVVGLSPWGAVAALDLAAAGVSALHLLDDGEVRDGDVQAVGVLDPAHRGRARTEAVSAALARLSPGCAVSTGPIVALAGGPLALDDTAWDLVLACVPGDDLLVLEGVARFAHAAGLVSLSASFDGLEAVVGPAVMPGRTACFSCARLRRLAASRSAAVDHAVHAALLARRAPPRAHGYPAPVVAALGHAVALAAIDLLECPERSGLWGSLATEGMTSLASSIHPVLPVPWCEVCGGAVHHATGAPPVDLSTARSPEELRRMLGGVVDARTGIVTEIVLGSQDSPYGVELPVMATAVVGAYARCALHNLRHDDPEDGAGKGLGVVEAMVSAVGEAVERYSAGRVDPRRIVRATAAALGGDTLTPERVSLYSEAQLEDPAFPFARWAREAPLDWTPGHWLDTGGPVYLPALVTWYDYPAPRGERFCQVTSSGLAAGPTFEEAALRAALELVERDAFVLSWMARLPGRQVRLDDAIAAPVRDLAGQLVTGAERLEVHLLDAGLHVPTAMCVVFGDGRRWPGATVSLAADLSPRRAVERAIVEQGQCGPYYRRLLEERRVPIPRRPEEVHTLEDHALYYFPPERAAAFAFLAAGEIVPAAALEEPAGPSLAVLVDRLRAAGMRVAVADLTSPDLLGTPFRVARAVGPDFQQIHFGHRLARLGNPRLAALARGGIHPEPHPLD